MTLRKALSFTAQAALFTFTALPSVGLGLSWSGYPETGMDVLLVFAHVVFPFGFN